MTIALCHGCGTWFDAGEATAHHVAPCRVCWFSMDKGVFERAYRKRAEFLRSEEGRAFIFKRAREKVA